ncbi:MAG: thioredoxin family protein [Planctomycetota bacterium]
MSDESIQPPPSKPTLSPKKTTAQFLWRWFWRAMIIPAIVAVWYCFYAPANHIAWADSYASAQRQAAETGKPVLLFYTGKWCVPCTIMKRNVWADEEVAATVNASFIPVMIDVGDPREAAAIEENQIHATPFTAIVDAQGQVLQWQQGGMSKADFLAMINGLDRPE